MNDSNPASGDTPATASTTPSETARKQTRSDRTMLVTVVLGHAVKHIFAAGFFILLPELKRDLALSNAAIGAISTSRMVVGGMLNLVAGYAADRLPHRWAAILGVSMAMVGVFYFVLGVAPNLGVIVFAAVMSSIAVTFWHPSAIGALARRFVNRRGLSISLHGAGGSIGETLGPLIAGVLLSYLTWRVILQGSLVPAVGAGVVIWLMLRGLKVQRGEGMSARVYLEAVRVFLGNRRLQILLVMVSGFSIAQGSLMTFLPIYLREDVGYTSFQTGLYLALAQGMGIVSQPALGYLSDRYGRRAVLLPCVTVLGLMVLGLSVAPHGFALVLNIIGVGAFAFPLLAIFLAAASDMAGEHLQATTVSLVFAATTVFSGVSPGIAGLLADTYGVTSVFVFAGSAGLVTAALLATQGWLGRSPRTV